MPASRSSARLAAAVLAAAACTAREPDLRPFFITAVDANGRSVVEGLTAAGEVQVTGIASRNGPTSITVQPSGGPAVTVSLRETGPIVIPDVVAQGPVQVELRGDPTSRGPGGAPLPIRGFRVADANGRWRFFAGEGDLTDPNGRPLVPRPLGPEAVGEDLPIIQVLSPTTYFEPAECGDLYYDRLRVTGVSESLVVSRDEQIQIVARGGEDLPPWTVRHVQTWHRAGDLDTSGACATALRSWFQAAGWR